jgi:uncharacterized protein YaiI (UPF0178 family)
MATQIVLEGILQKFNPVNRNNGRIYDEKIFREQLRKYEIEMKMKNRMRKIENILSNLK